MNFKGMYNIQKSSFIGIDVFNAIIFDILTTASSFVGSTSILSSLDSSGIFSPDLVRLGRITAAFSPVFGTILFKEVVPTCFVSLGGLMIPPIPVFSLRDPIITHILV